MAGKGERSRARIVSAASQLFHEQGFSASSMGDVAAAADVLKGNLSYYFATKADLLQGVVAQRCSQLESQLADFVAGSDSPVDQVHRFIDMIEQQAPTLARYGCPLGSLATDICKADAFSQRLGEQLLATCMTWLQGRFALRLPPQEATQAAEQLLVMAQGTAVLAQSFRDQMLVVRQCATMRKLASQLLKPARPRR